jgi:DNA modification methylase
MRNEVILGDCLEVIRGMGDGCVDMVFMDPPYGHNNNNNGDLISRWEEALGKGASPQENFRPIANDGAEANDIFRAILPELRRVLAPGACCCCCGGGGGPDPQFARWSLWLDDVFDFKQMVVWDKGPMGMGWHYRRSYETVLVAQRPGAKCRWFDTSKKVENVIRPGYRGIRKIIPSAADHPTPKPWQLAAHFIELHTEPGDLVLDPFCGGGSTLVAAKNFGRAYLGIEMEESWVEMSRRRVAMAGLPLLEGMA